MEPWVTLRGLFRADGGKEEDGSLKFGSAGAIGQFNVSVIIGPVGRSLISKVQRNACGVVRYGMASSNSDKQH